MKRSLSAFLASLFSVVPILVVVPAVDAQIDLGCRLVSSRVLPFEAAEVEVKIKNRTGGPLVLAADGANARLSFDVEASPGELLSPLEGKLLLDPIRLGPGQEYKTSLNLASSFDLRKTGPYTVTGIMEWNGMLFRSGRMYLDVVPGMEIDSIRSPAAGGELRTFRLLTLNRERADMIFLRIDDERVNICYGVVELGCMLRSFKPVMQVDQRGQVHILHQSGPSRFKYSVFNSEGIPVSDEYVAGTGQGLGLTTLADGSVRVSGSSR
ncbi:MAG: hypothetical protein KJ626_10525 [Verrucomicrobia bacterium]|nr:hypothetical protein [Verrucomicrobiota bacterium]